MLGINTKTDKSLDNTVILTSMKKINEDTILNVSEPNTLKMSNNEPHNFLDSENIENKSTTLSTGEDNISNINKDITLNNSASNIIEGETLTKNNDIDKKKDNFLDLQEKWKKLDTAKKAGVVGAIVGTLITLSPLIGVLAALTLPGLILGGIAHGVTKAAKSKGVKTVVEKTTDGMRKIGKDIKSMGKNVVDNLTFTKEPSNAEKFAQDINSEISKLVVASKSELTTEDRNNTEKLAFQKEIAEMIQNKDSANTVIKLVKDGKIPDISSQDIERCVEKGKSTFKEDQKDFKALVESIGAAVQKSFSEVDEFKKEVEKVQKENSPNTKLEVNTKSVEQVNDNNIEK